MHTREFQMPPPIARKWEIGSSSVRDREIALSVCQSSQRARGMEFVVVPAAGAPEARPWVAQATLPRVAHKKCAGKGKGLGRGKGLAEFGASRRFSGCGVRKT